MQVITFDDTHVFVELDERDLRESVSICNALGVNAEGICKVYVNFFKRPLTHGEKSTTFAFQGNSEKGTIQTSLL